MTHQVIKAFMEVRAPQEIDPVKITERIIQGHLNHRKVINKKRMMKRVAQLRLRVVVTKLKLMDSLGKRLKSLVIYHHHQRVGRVVNLMVPKKKNLC